MRGKASKSFIQVRCCFTETREVMKLTKSEFGSYFDALQLGYAIYLYSQNKDEKLERYLLNFVHSAHFIGNAGNYFLLRGKNYCYSIKDINHITLNI